MQSNLQSRFAKAAAAVPLASQPATDPKWRTPQVPELLFASKVNADKVNEDRSIEVGSRESVKEPTTEGTQYSSPSGRQQQRGVRGRSWTNEEIEKLRTECLSNKPSLRGLVHLFPGRALSDIQRQRATIEGDIAFSREGSASLERDNDPQQEKTLKSQEAEGLDANAHEMDMDDMDFGGDVSLDTPRDHSNPHATSSIEEILGEISQAPSKSFESDSPSPNTNEHAAIADSTSRQASLPAANDENVQVEIVKPSETAKENASVNLERPEAALQEDSGLRTSTLAEDDLIDPALAANGSLQQSSDLCCLKKTPPIEANLNGLPQDKPPALHSSTAPDPANNAPLNVPDIVEDSNVPDSTSIVPRAGFEPVSPHPEDKAESRNETSDTSALAPYPSLYSPHNDQSGFIIPHEHHRFKVPVQDFMPSLSGFREDIIIPSVDPLPFELYIGEEWPTHVEASKAGDPNPSLSHQVTSEQAQIHDSEMPIDPALSITNASAHAPSPPVDSLRASVQKPNPTSKRGGKRRKRSLDQATHSKKQKSSSPRDSRPILGSSIWREMISNFSQQGQSQSRSLSESRDCPEEEGTIVLKPRQNIQPRNEIQQNPTPAAPLQSGNPTGSLNSKSHHVVAISSEVRSESNSPETTDMVEGQLKISEISTEAIGTDPAASAADLVNSIEGSSPTEGNPASDTITDIAKVVSETRLHEIERERESADKLTADISTINSVGSLSRNAAEESSEEIAVEINLAKKSLVIVEHAQATDALVADTSPALGSDREEAVPNSSLESISSAQDNPTPNLGAITRPEEAEAATASLEEPTSITKDNLVAIAEAVIETAEENGAPVSSADAEPIVRSEGKQAIANSFEASTFLAEETSIATDETAAEFVEEETNDKPVSDTKSPNQYQGMQAVCDSFEEQTWSAEGAPVATIDAVAESAQEEAAPSAASELAEESSIREETRNDSDGLYLSGTIDEPAMNYEPHFTPESPATQHGSPFASRSMEEGDLPPDNSPTMKPTPPKKRGKISSTPASASKSSLRKSLFSLQKRKLNKKLETPRKSIVSSSQESRLSLSSLLGDDSEDELTLTTPTATTKASSRPKTIVNVKSPRCGKNGTPCKRSFCLHCVSSESEVGF